MTDDAPLALILARTESIALVGSTNPYLVYVGGLDRASQPTMMSAARLVASALSNGEITNPAVFPWHRLDYGTVKRLRSMLRESGMAPRTVNKALTLARSIMREAWILDLVPHEQYQKICEIENLESRRLPAGRVVERDEIARLLVACHDPEDANGLRDAALISLLVGAGLRENEAVHLTRGDYNADKGTIRVRFGKGHKQREAYLEIAFEAPLRRLFALVSGGVDEPLLPRLAPSGGIMRPLRAVSTQSVHLALARRAIQAGVTVKNAAGEDAPSFTPHDLRRTFITHQLESGTDPLRVARAVGHANPQTTMIYDRRTAESDRRAIRGDKSGKDEAGVDEKRREAAFTWALIGGDPRDGDLGVVETPLVALLDPAWRAPLRGLRMSAILRVSATFKKKKHVAATAHDIAAALNGCPSSTSVRVEACPLK